MNWCLCGTPCAVEEARAYAQAHPYRRYRSWASWGVKHATTAPDPYAPTPYAIAEWMRTRHVNRTQARVALRRQAWAEAVAEGRRIAARQDGSEAYYAALALLGRR